MSALRTSIRRFAETSRARSEARAVERYLSEVPAPNARIEIEAVLMRRRTLR